MQLIANKTNMDNIKAYLDKLQGKSSGTAKNGYKEYDQLEKELMKQSPSVGESLNGP